MTFPIICTADNAWLSEGYYFWYDIDDAHYWGLTKKQGTGYFEVYSANIECENVLDTVFNEDHYLFWLKNVEAAIKRMVKINIKPTIKDINDYFRDRNIWSKVDGVMFQDISKSKKRNTVPGFYYKKRIQIAVYSENIIHNFALQYDCECV